MKELYLVAQNAFSISVAEDLPAWAAVSSRYAPFAVLTAEKPVLEADIRTRQLPQCDAEVIYEPAKPGAGFIAARVSRLPDSCLAMEFMHTERQETRVWMKMPPTLDKADIGVGPDSDEGDACFLTHALMIAFMLATAHNGTLLTHASAVTLRGKAYLFQGKSGSGKSTHSGLWVKNIAGTELLNDDNPVVRFSADGAAMAWGSPWSGKTHCYRNAYAPIGAFTRIVQAPENALRRLPPLKAYASLTASVFFLPFVSDRLMEIRHKTIERLAQTVACCELRCRPDDEAAFVCQKGLSAY